MNNTNEKSLYIGGKLYKGSQPYELINPATSKSVALIHGASQSDTILALQHAKEAYEAWSNTPVKTRVEWMNKLKDAIKLRELELRESLHLEMGKPWASTEGDFSMLIDSLEYYANLITNKELEDTSQSVADYSHNISRKPIGVAAAFLAWNFPLLNIAYKIGPAMAAGCPLIIKPSKVTSLSACIIGEICASINLPSGVISIVSGDDQLVGDTISASTVPSLISLIGSAAVGKHVTKVSATSIKRYSMELGGNAPFIVLSDADLELASDIASTMKTENAGQICVSPNRIFVHSSVHDKFVELLKQKLVNKTVGFDKTQNIDMGPMIDTNACARVNSLVESAIKDGAKLVLGGGKPKGITDGAFYAPTLLTSVTQDMDIYKQEIFGPVASVISFDSIDEVITKANDTDAGLSSFVFGKDTAIVNRIANALAFGEVHINGINYAINLPHCGVKQSGTGVDCSEHALNEYFAVKRISKALL